MSDNTKSLSPRMSPPVEPPAPTQFDATKSVNVTFTLKGTASWSSSPSSYTDSSSVVQMTYNLINSTSGWNLSRITIGTHNSFTGTGYLNVTGQAEYWVTSFSDTSIVLVVRNNNKKTQSETVSITLTVNNPSANPNSYTSPDPQIVLEPR